MLVQQDDYEPIEKIPARYVREVLWRRGDLEFLLWPQQIPIWNALNQLPLSVLLIVLLCARQFGKSTLGVILALAAAIKLRDCCILIMGPDTRQTVDIVSPKMRFLTRTAPPGLIKPMKAHNRFHVYHDLNPRASDYTEIIIGGMNENSTSQRGKTVEQVQLEEIVDVPEDDYMESIESDLAPAMLHAKVGRMIFQTTLPKYPSHPFITQTIPKAKLSNSYYCYTINDNTAITKEQYDKAVNACGGEHTDTWKREYLCQIVRDRSRVCLPDYSDANVADVILPGKFFWNVTVDWGGVRDKTCAILHLYDYLNDWTIFWDEQVYESGIGTDVIVDGLRDLENRWKAIPIARWTDVSGQTMTDLINIHKYQCYLPNKGDWLASLQSLNVRFAMKKAFIHPRCKFLRVSAESGILNKQRNDFDRSEALGHMDGVAAMMYALRMENRENPYRDSFSTDDAIPTNQHVFIKPDLEKEIIVDPFSMPIQINRSFMKRGLR